MNFGVDVDILSEILWSCHFDEDLVASQWKSNVLML